ncbi:hypothetical protein [Vitiosangium sp. GDMCC 1.1324]|uniref:hypothetical protein n=1 Tax=Vitiosangium sp. (strain GDMCC 1.1324) TaxID=2138576 RepID=UPI000D3883F6|nr:hypothetical protein [Vitiosangium sp. GDMCC 1.1324]PTL84033.1 hypothetical protein DAT35_11305 [Vitiosangium sp. GDMCC 1.1324]
MIAVDRFNGGSKVMTLAGAVGVIGLVLTIVGFVTSAQATMFSYLLAFTYWVGIAVAAIIMQAIFHTAKAKWVTVVRRTMETMGASVVVFIILALPILFGAKYLFPWVDPTNWVFPGTDGVKFTEVELHHLHHKHPYLNLTFFYIRQAIYFAVWAFVAWRLRSWSTQQDESGALELTVKLRTFSPGALPFLALTITFAGFDWLMTLTPLWQSTIFGVYYFAGSFLAAFCVLTISAVNAQGKNEFGSLLTTAHYHNLGKLMLAFTAFWAYIAFSQFLLIWIANLPEEAGWYKLRIEGPWRSVSLVVFFFGFLLPFFTLLSRNLKLKPKLLAMVAVYLMVMHAVDMYWLIWPAFSPQAPSFHWTIITAFAGVGGLAVAGAIWLARGRYTVPVKDPYIAEALRYVQP